VSGLVVIDGDGLILGRLASITAKRLLQGERIYIVNAEKVVISGDRDAVLSNYLKKRMRGSKEKGPYFPKRPDTILKRTVRGMLPYKRERGRKALSNLKVYVGVPKELEGEEKETVEEAHISRLSTTRYIKLGEVSKFLGGKF
jgi:large subunit ribosomal protein L13